MLHQCFRELDLTPSRKRHRVTLTLVVLGRTVGLPCVQVHAYVLLQSTLKGFYACLADQSQSGNALTEREGKPFTEAEWSNTESATTDAYCKAKTLQEKAAWDFVKELPGEKSCY